jgi:O-antigen ligase
MHPSSRRSLIALAWLLHSTVVAWSLFWLLKTACSSPRAASSAPVPAWGLSLWGASFLLLAVAPVWPALGLLVYAALTPIVVARYDPDVTGITLNMAVLEWVALLTVTGSIAWMVRTRHRPTFHLHWLFWLLVVFVAWIALTSCVAAHRDGYFAPAPDENPRTYVQALVLFFLASQCLSGELTSLGMALALGLALIVRTRLLSPRGVWRDEDVGSLIAVVFPLGVLALSGTMPWTARFPRSLGPTLRWVIRVAGALILGVLLWELLFTENRTGAMGLAAALLVMVILSPKRFYLLGAALPIAVGAALYLGSSVYWKRFSDLWTGGSEQDSAISRLRLWRAGWRMLLDHPIVGVGPGNFENYLPRYAPTLEPKPAHSNFVGIAAETGWPGLILYVAFFGGAILVAFQVLRVCGRDWPGPGARLLLATLVAYQVIGLTISRQDMVLAYIFAGWSLAFWLRLTGRPPLLPAGSSP